MNFRIQPDIPITFKLVMNYFEISEKWVRDWLQYIIWKQEPILGVLKKYVYEVDDYSWDLSSASTENSYVEDSIFMFFGLLADEYWNWKTIKTEERISITEVLDYYETKIDESKHKLIPKLRYCSLIDHWCYELKFIDLITYLNKLVHLLSLISIDDISTIVQWCKVSMKLLSQIQNIELEFAPRKRVRPGETDYHSLIRDNLDWEQIFDVILEKDLFNEKFSSKLSLTELFQITSFIELVVEKIDLKKNRDKVIRLLKSLDQKSISNGMEMAFEWEIIRIWQRAISQLTNDEELLHMTFEKLVSMTNHSNHEAFWIQTAKNSGFRKFSLYLIL